MYFKRRGVGFVKTGYRPERKMLIVERRKRPKKRKKIFLLIIMLVVIISVISGILIYRYQNSVYRHSQVEAGTKVDIKDFLKNKNLQASITDDSDRIDVSVPGDYQIGIKSWPFRWDCTLTVVDTIPPIGETATVQSNKDEVIKADDFFTTMEDHTAVKAAYETEPDFSRYGEQEVLLTLTDAGGNVSKYTERLVICPVKSELQWEAGQPQPKLSDFLYNGDIKAELTTDLSAIDYTEIAEHQVDIRYAGFSYQTILKIADTVPPVLKVVSHEGYTGVEIPIEDFIESIVDVTEVTYQYENPPDFSKEGNQEVVIIVEDEAKNITRGVAGLKLIRDTEPPVITGVKDITVYANETIQYRKDVSVTDNYDTDVTFTVDNSQVNLKKSGTYTVTYTAVDRAGNVTQQTAKVTVQYRMYSQEAIDELADNVLNKIIKPEMTQKQKMRAIFDWTNQSIRFIPEFDHSDEQKAAYIGLAWKKGDCFAYACVSDVLLKKVGIKTMIISKIPTLMRHYWNLVDIGEGWHHFDANPRDDKFNRCYVKDDKLMEYSVVNDNMYNYDRSLYPKVE